MKSDCVSQVDFETIFVTPTALTSSDIGRVLSPNLTNLFSFVYDYSQSYVHVRLHVYTCTNEILFAPKLVNLSGSHLLLPLSCRRNSPSLPLGNLLRIAALRHHLVRPASTRVSARLRQSDLHPAHNPHSPRFGPDLSVCCLASAKRAFRRSRDVTTKRAAWRQENVIYASGHWVVGLRLNIVIP